MENIRFPRDSWRAKTCRVLSPPSMQLLCCHENRSLTIKLRKRKPEKKVEWTSDTVDNEHMGRRSSKCCCIYEKPRAFGESSTESDEEEEEGCGHTHCALMFLPAQMSSSQPSPLLTGILPSFSRFLAMHSYKDESKTYHH
ncbi:E3 ubiquitin-protein ligase PPP1R11 isoform X1 [Lutra lutra]|uniref:E3 ubiquitin-protein ligase PPP1R11 isoform X1 n=1 Tax=Lutra lutra TaxID=9657 RepID=UPI001FD29283|nr:E3 ubiquitin-protein ligase PPP1R11 isoform X1 [Lutra lutra]